MTGRGPGVAPLAGIVTTAPALPDHARRHGQDDRSAAYQPPPAGLPAAGAAAGAGAAALASVVWQP